MSMPPAALESTKGDHSPLKLGSRLRKYEILQLIGQGGYASVYRARDTFFQRDVAIKVIHRLGGVTEDMVRRGKAEAVFLNKVRHPNIVEVYDADVTDGGMLYIVMEHLTGRTLQEVLREHRRLAVEEVLSMTVQIADAVEAAHALGAIHRDLKPDNIFVTAPNRLKVLDFGIAKFMNAVGAKTTAKDALQGSVLFMSPEHVQGIKVGKRTDIYALGIILYTALYGNHPITLSQERPETAWAVATWHVHTMPPPLCDVAPWVPIYVSRFVSSACAKNPARRPESMAEVRDQARALLKRFLTESRGELQGKVRELSTPLKPTDPKIVALPKAISASESVAPEHPSQVATEREAHGVVPALAEHTVPGMGALPTATSLLPPSERPAEVDRDGQNTQKQNPTEKSPPTTQIVSIVPALAPTAVLQIEPKVEAAVAPAPAPRSRDAQRTRAPSVNRLLIGAALLGPLVFGSATMAYLQLRRSATQPKAAVVAASVGAVPSAASTPQLKGIALAELDGAPATSALATPTPEPAVSATLEAVSSPSGLTAELASSSSPSVLPAKSASSTPRKAIAKPKQLSPSELRLKALEDELARRQRAKSGRVPSTARDPWR